MITICTRGVLPMICEASTLASSQPVSQRFTRKCSSPAFTFCNTRHSSKYVKRTEVLFNCSFYFSEMILSYWQQLSQSVVNSGQINRKRLSSTTGWSWSSVLIVSNKRKNITVQNISLEIFPCKGVCAPDKFTSACKCTQYMCEVEKDSSWISISDCTGLHPPTTHLTASKIDLSGRPAEKYIRYTTTYHLLANKSSLGRNNYGQTGNGTTTPSQDGGSKCLPPFPQTSWNWERCSRGNSES